MYKFEKISEVSHNFSFNCFPKLIIENISELDVWVLIPDNSAFQPS